MLKFAVRWNTVSWRACSAITGIAWIAEDPVPITATRLPVKSTPSCGHQPVWYVSPRKLSRPSISGSLAADRQPVAITTNRASIRPPVSVSTSQRSAVSSNVARVTRVRKLMSRRRPSRSATWLA